MQQQQARGTTTKCRPGGRRCYISGLFKFSSVASQGHVAGPRLRVGCLGRCSGVALYHNVVVLVLAQPIEGQILEWIDAPGSGRWSTPS